MNWCRTILDSVMMAAFFNLLAIIAVLVNPRIMMGVAIRSRYRKRPLNLRQSGKKQYNYVNALVRFFR